MSVYSARFLHAFSGVILGIEGGYSNHPDDPGGRTIYGISEKSNPDLWVDGPPTLEQAQQRYWENYWSPRYEQLTHAPCATELFEAGVLCGRSNAIRFLQRAYNALKLKTWIPLTVDGRIGPKTIAAVNGLCQKREWAHALYRGQNHFQACYLLECNNPAMVRGWFAKRLD